MNADDRVRVIGRPAEHPRELHRPRSAFEIGHEPFGFGDRWLVARFNAEIEEHLRVLDVLRELLEGVDVLLDPRAFARELLRFLMVVPKTRNECLLTELIDFALQPRYVKDAPLAQRGTF